MAINKRHKAVCYMVHSYYICTAFKQITFLTRSTMGQCNPPSGPILPVFTSVAIWIESGLPQI